MNVKQAELRDLIDKGLTRQAVEEAKSCTPRKLREYFREILLERRKDKSDIKRKEKSNAV